MEGSESTTAGPRGMGKHWAIRQDLLLTTLNSRPLTGSSSETRLLAHVDHLRLTADSHERFNRRSQF